MAVQTQSQIHVQDTHTPSPTASKTVFDFIPLWLVLALAKPYMAGASEHDAIEIAHKLFTEHGYCSTLDILGEDMKSDEDCDRAVEMYKELITAVKINQIKTPHRRKEMTVSLKPSTFSTMAPRFGRESEAAQEKAFDRINTIVDHALKSEVNVTLEAEDNHWTNFQLEAYFALIEAGYTNLGTVLQSRLFRTEKDVKRFDQRMRVRMVLGIYNEPAQIALTDKRKMKERVVEYAGELLANGAYVELATHDLNCVDSFYRHVAVPNRIAPSNFEHQFLMGVPRTKLQQGLVSGNYFQELVNRVPAADADYVRGLAAEGVNVRMYLPYGEPKASGAYCRRRLRENPNMITYGIKNVLGFQS